MIISGDFATYGEDFELEDELSDDDSGDEWCITDDDTADWAVRKIAAHRAEFERVKAIADHRIAAINAKIERLKKRCDNKTQGLEYKLAEYFRSVPHKSTKTTEKYQLLSGTLSMKKAAKKPVVDDDKLVEWLAANKYTDYIKTVQKPCWGDFKKTLDLSGDIPVVKETGEIVEGVSFTETSEEFEVQIK